MARRSAPCFTGKERRAPAALGRSPLLLLWGKLSARAPQEHAMSENTNFGFAKLVPGFDFLQNLAKGASQGLPQMPSLSNWIAPTLNVEELDKRIAELKAVHFWLDQNGKALGATIQALEVQKMTLATLQGMNFNMGELASALTLKTDGSSAAAAAKPAAAAPAAAAAKAKPDGAKAAKEGNGAGVDPLQWWGALTHQFQEIAANAMKDVAQKTASESTRSTAAAAPATAKSSAAPAKKGAAKKSAPRKRTAKS